MKYIILLLFVSCSTNWLSTQNDELSYMRLPSNESSLVEIKPNKLTNFYKKYLSKTPTKWLAQSLPADYHLPSSGPAEPFYNNSIIWAVDPLDQTIAGFRPVNTTTGCNSGCSPVVFHLKFSDNGNVTDLIEDSNELLRKKWHRAYTHSDKAKALRLAQKIPEALIKVSQPKLLADDSSVYPPQTWTALENLLVKESAYTSYRIVQAAFQIKTFLQTTPQEKNETSQYLQYLNSHLNGRWKNLNQLRVSFDTVSKIIRHPNMRPTIKAQIFSSPQNILLNMIAFGGANEVQAVKSFLSNKEYKTTHKGVVCDFKKNLLTFNKGNKLLLDMNRSGDWPSCNQTLDKIYPLLASAALKDLASAKELSKGMELKDIPPVVTSDPDLLKHYSELTKLLENNKAYNWSVANLKVRYPLLPIEDKVSSDDIANAELDYKKELRRAMLHADVDFPKFEASNHSSKVKMPQSGKQIYIFFATWCPHCKAKIKEWASFPESFWKKVALVEVFPKEKSRSRIDNFCKEINLETKYCNEILTIDNENKRNALYRSISLSGVPRIIINRPDQKVGYFDYRPPHKKGSDVQRDLNWILEEVKTNR